MDRPVVRHIRVKMAWLISSLAIAGCLPYQDRPLSLPETLDQFESRTLDERDLQVYLQENLDVQQRSAAQWNLAELTLAAFFYSPELDIARAQWAVARGRRAAAAERPNPSFGVTPGFNSTTGYGASVSPWIVDAALDIPVETAGKRGYRIAEAEQLSEAAHLQIAQTAWELRHQVRETMLDLYAATETAHLLEGRRTIQEDTIELLRAMFDAGEISANELSQARILGDEDRLAMLDAEKQQVQTCAHLASVIGVPAKALESKELSFDVFKALPEEAPPPEMQRQALLNRADLRAALAAYQASQAALQQEIARQYPDIQIGPGYEFDQSENKWMLGVSATLPVFNRNRGAIATAEADRAHAEAQVRALQARIVGDLEQAMRSYRVSMRKVKAVETLLEERQIANDRMRKMYEFGQVSRLEVDTAGIEFNAAALDRLNALAEAQRAFGQIENAMHVATDLPDWSGRIQCERRDNDHE